MSRGENDDSHSSSAYEEAMEALSSLITKRSRADSSNQGHGFSLMFDYIKILDLEEPISRMKVIHVAGTKGKGSTCAFTESILRNCGFHTGLFISPHLIDVRERFRLDGSDICEKKFLAYFWWCWDSLKEKTSGNIPMPTYFRFLALLAFKMFSAEQVDVVILEVGLGGKFDATNVVHKPVVCGIASLGYDHMEILGNTLGEIAGEKAGIFKQGVPAFTVPQPDEAMRVLEEKASNLDVHLQVAQPLDVSLLNGLHLGLDGVHQYYNAGLAIALCSTWLQRTGHTGNYLDQTTSLCQQFLSGLTMATLQGRAQIVADQHIDNERTGDLMFYLDGAHSPESMEVCADWFCRAISGDDGKHNLANYQHGTSIASNKLEDSNETPTRNSTQILLFNCMSVRDPQLLLPRLMHGCANHGVQFKKAIFVPNVSAHDKVWSSALPPDDFRAHLSWQRSIQKVWQSLLDREKGVDARNTDRLRGEIEEGKERNYKRCENSTVFPSLPLAIKWLRDSVQQNKSVRFQVLVTGSLHLVGDVLRLIKK